MRRRLRSSTRALLGVAGVLSLSIPAPARAHVGGQVVRPILYEPNGLWEVPASGVKVQWTDGNQDPTGVVRFGLRRGNAPPVVVPSEELAIPRLLVHEVPVSDPTDSLTLVDLPVGAWTLIATTHDPPLCAGHGFLGALLVSRKDGEPAPLGGWFDSPDSAQHQGALPVDVVAISPSPPTLSIHLGKTAPVYDPPPDGLSLCLKEQTHFVPVATVGAELELRPDPDAGPDRYRFVADMDLSGTPEGSWTVQGVLSVEGEEDYTFYGSGQITTIALGGIDEGEEVAEPDLIVLLDPEPEPETPVDAGGSSSVEITEAEILGEPEPFVPRVVGISEPEAKDAGNCAGGGASPGPASMLLLLLLLASRSLGGVRIRS